ncbi:MAG: GNAT family N-acetyltransferase [Gemmata sp.]
MTAAPLSLADERDAVAALGAAFANYPLFAVLCPGAARRPRATEALCRFLFRTAVRVRGAFGTPDRTAVACAWPPGREWPSRWDAICAGGAPLAWRLGWRAFRVLTRLEAEFDARRAAHVPGPHWYVPLLGVRPEAQGRGLSRVTLEPIFAAADRGRVPVYLETATEPNVAIYKKLGFELLGRRVLTGGLPNWELLRRPVG